jgi:hypothetical protein
VMITKKAQMAVAKSLRVTGWMKYVSWLTNGPQDVKDSSIPKKKPILGFLFFGVLVCLTVRMANWLRVYKRLVCNKLPTVFHSSNLSPNVCSSQNPQRAPSRGRASALGSLVQSGRRDPIGSIMLLNEDEMSTCAEACKKVEGLWVFRVPRAWELCSSLPSLFHH